MLNLLRRWFPRLIGPCNHTYHTLAEFDDAPTPDGGYTHLIIFGCTRCKYIDPFPRLNWDLTDSAFKANLNQTLDNLGWKAVA